MKAQITPSMGTHEINQMVAKEASGAMRQIAEIEAGGKGGTAPIPTGGGDVVKPGG